ncbi:MAG: division/cell wall cluster transcriptional repressor MraZ [Oscillospiraceae bacterium]|nr:division/cell wall cluster transcriptional repressor MraZ [Oscillospiraceae bacterium]
MFGQYKHTLDAKGRLIVPSKLREELGELFYISKAPDVCLTVYTAAEWQRVVDHFNSLPITASRSLRYFMGNVWQIEPDKQGRFLLPESLRTFAGIDQDVIFLGLGGRAEIWAAERYEAEEPEHLTPEAIEQALKELGF